MSQSSRRREAAKKSFQIHSGPRFGVAGCPGAEGSPAAASIAPNSSPNHGLGVLVWHYTREYFGWSNTSTCLWPRWLMLRSVGIVYVIIFANVIAYQSVLAGPDGLVPVARFLDHIRNITPNGWAAFLAAPSLFWFGPSDAMNSFLAWTGLAAAISLTLNFWPRMALFVCWATFLSFVSTWSVFSGAQLDNLMVETALLCIPFAPRGFRPGLGTGAAPWPLATFTVRWFLFRVMFESGVVKLAAGDPHWRNFTAMDVMYVTSPFPTFLGYIDHSLPWTYHVFEILLTFFAELVAPVLAVVGGRRGRWIAFCSWTVFQAGIQLTNNFGWLNTASIGLGLLLLDDQMIAAAAFAIRRTSLGHWLGRRGAGAQGATAPHWQHLLLGAALATHFSLSLFYLAKTCGAKVYSLPDFITKPVSAVAPFGSVNEYSLYARFVNIREQVEFLGSNDGGRTWRTYEFRYMPQRTDQICPHIAPWFARFDASLEIAVWNPEKQPIFTVIGSRLLEPSTAVVALFQQDPFPDSPPTSLRMQSYRLTFTNPATQRATGQFWNKELTGDYLPALHVDANGHIVPFDLTQGDAEFKRGNLDEALAFFTQQFRAGSSEAGLRLVSYYMQISATPLDIAKGFPILAELARQGDQTAECYFGVCHEHGIGTAPNLPEAAHWYRLAADQGNALACLNLGRIYVETQSPANHDIEALAYLLQAAYLNEASDPPVSQIREEQPALVKTLITRMSPVDVAKAKHKAKLWQTSDF